MIRLEVSTRLDLFHSFGRPSAFGSIFVSGLGMLRIFTSVPSLPERVENCFVALRRAGLGAWVGCAWVFSFLLFPRTPWTYKMRVQ